MPDPHVTTAVLTEDGVVRTINITVVLPGATPGQGGTMTDAVNETAEGEDSTFNAERFAGDPNTRAWDTNLKRTYDEYQDLALTAARRSQVNYDQLNNVALQALQNAVEAANLAGHQAVKHTSDTDAQKVRHADIAIENQWESGAEVSGEAVIAALAAALAARLNQAA